MGYNKDKWAKRTRNRSDLSLYLTHLTKDSNDSSTLDRLIKILEERTIIGSSKTGFIVGENSAVCFQDSPLYAISQNVYHEVNYRKENGGGKKRYTAFGLAFEKTHIYRNGGRPCIYEKTEIAKKMLPEDELWRIVSFDLSNDQDIIDWSHEREWRIKGDFSFTYDRATVLLPHDNWYRKFIERVRPEILKELAGVVVLSKLL